MAEPLTLAALERLAALEQQAKEGPWSAAPQINKYGFRATEIHGRGLSRYLGAMNTSSGEDNHINADLVVELRNHAPDLLRLARLGLEHERLAATLATLEAEVDAALERAAMAQKRGKGDKNGT
jgi:hypothetical protein